MHLFSFIFVVSFFFDKYYDAPFSKRIVRTVSGNLTRDLINVGWNLTKPILPWMCFHWIFLQCNVYNMWTPESIKTDIFIYHQNFFFPRSWKEPWKSCCFSCSEWSLSLPIHFWSLMGEDLVTRKPFSQSLRNFFTDSILNSPMHQQGNLHIQKQSNV